LRRSTHSNICQQSIQVHACIKGGAVQLLLFYLGQQLDALKLENRLFKSIF